MIDKISSKLLFVSHRLNKHQEILAIDVLHFTDLIILLFGLLFVSSSGNLLAFSLATLRFTSLSSLRALTVEQASYESNLTVTKAS